MSKHPSSPFPFLETAAAWENLLQKSEQRPCVLLKHSPRCPISQMAFWRLSEDWSLQQEEALLYGVDVLQQPALAQRIAQDLQEQHASPQLLIIRDKDCIFEADRLEIDPDEIADFIRAKDWW